jgi:palmitoyl-protein thioesterase
MSFKLIIALSLLVASASAYDLDFPEDVRAFIEGTEHLKAIVKMAQEDEAGLAKMIVESPLAAIASNVTVGPWRETNNSVPLVVAHGMGDSCFNPGMKSITKASGNHLGVYSTCIPTGGNWITDTIGGFLKNMDASVDFFAKRVKADPQLAHGFDAFGLSQGNNVIRGYITKYNDPPVRNFMSICGINAGVGAFPVCSPQIPVVGGVCKALTEVLGALAYNPLSQGILFQADYFRDPSRVNASSYLKNSQLAQWNNEGTANLTYNANWAKTEKFVWVMGTEDTVVWPREGERWGAMSTVPGEEFKTVDAMKDTRWYKEDTFGLRTADEAGKNHFESFKGQHIRMTEEELFGWFDKYFN